MSYSGETGELSASAFPSDSLRRVTMTSGTVGSFVATGDVTQGRYGLYRWDMPANAGGAGAHFHRSFSEAFYVVAGNPTVYDGREWGARGPGDFVHVPEGGIHGFRNDSGAPASMLILFAPGIARETYFLELAEIGASGREMTKADWADLYARHDQVMVE